MRAAPRLDSLENPPREARKLLKIRSEYFHPPLRDAAHAHSSRRLCLDGSIGQQAPKEVSARHAQVRAHACANGWPRSRTRKLICLMKAFCTGRGAAASASVARCESRMFIELLSCAWRPLYSVGP